MRFWKKKRRDLVKMGLTVYGLGVALTALALNLVIFLDILTTGVSIIRESEIIIASEAFLLLTGIPAFLWVTWKAISNVSRRNGGKIYVRRGDMPEYPENIYISDSDGFREVRVWCNWWDENE